MKSEIGMLAVFMIVLIFVGISLIINTSKSCDVNIDYDVTVNPKINSSSASLAEIKLACCKLCLDELRSDSSMMRICLEKCEALE